MIDFVLRNLVELASLPGSVPKLRSFILDQAVRGNLTTDWRGEHPEVEPASELLERIREEKRELVKAGKIKKQKELPPVEPGEVPFAVPESWEWVRLGTVAEYIQRGKGPKYSETPGVRVISQKCVRWTGLDIAPSRFITQESIAGYTDERWLQTDDLLWNSTGTGTIGRMCKVPRDQLEENGPLVADSHVTVVRMFRVLPDYMLRFVQGPFVQEDFESNASGSTNQIELATATVRQFPVPTPPIDEQTEIVRRVDELMTV
jgi:type I restriction enzyme, S subunit